MDLINDIEAPCCVISTDMAYFLKIDLIFIPEKYYATSLNITDYILVNYQKIL